MFTDLVYVLCLDLDFEIKMIFRVIVNVLELR